MIKYSVYKTIYCNALILRLDVKPIYEGSKVVRYLVKDRHAPPQTMSHLPLVLPLDNAFDTAEDATRYAKLIMEDHKINIVNKLRIKTEQAFEKLNKMINHNPRIKHINIAK